MLNLALNVLLVFSTDINLRGLSYDTANILSRINHSWCILLLLILLLLLISLFRFLILDLEFSLIASNTWIEHTH